MNPDEIIAIVPAAGNSTRMGLGQNHPQKILYRFADGESVLEKSLFSLNRANINKVVIATSDNISEKVRQLVSEKVLRTQEWQKIDVIAGGKTRFESVKNSLKYVHSSYKNTSIKVVVIHDGARPFCDPLDIIAALQKVNEKTGVVLGVPVVNTIKIVADDGSVSETLDRNQLFEIQTPQSFPFERLLTAYENSSSDISFDDSQVFESFGGRVIVSESSRNNIKLTYPADIPYFEHLAQVLKCNLEK